MTVHQRNEMVWAQRGPVDRTGWVYFVEGAGLIKIGTAKVVDQRLSTMRSGSPIPLTLLLAIPGGREIEKFLHFQYAHLQHHLEWFTAGADLLAHIERLRWRSARGEILVCKKGTPRRRKWDIPRRYRAA